MALEKSLNERAKLENDEANNAFKGKDEQGETIEDGGGSMEETTKNTGMNMGTDFVPEKEQDLDDLTHAQLHTGTIPDPESRLYDGDDTVHSALSDK